MDQPIHLLSNNHVVADSNRGRPGDVVLQPGPSDGGLPADDRIGVLDRMIEMRSATANLVDAATVVIDDGVEIDDTYPAGPLAGWADADVGIDGQVEGAGDVRAAKQELAARLAGDPRVTGVGITRRHGRVRPLPQRRS